MNGEAVSIFTAAKHHESRPNQLFTITGIVALSDLLNSAEQTKAAVKGRQTTLANATTPQ